MTTAEEKRSRDRERLDAQREAAASAIKKKVDEKKAEKADEPEGFEWLNRTAEDDDSLIERDDDDFSFLDDVEVGPVEEL